MIKQKKKGDLLIRLPETFEFYYGVFIGIAVLAALIDWGAFNKTVFVPRDTPAQPIDENATSLIDHQGHDVSVTCTDCAKTVWHKGRGGDIDFNSLMPHEGHGVAINCEECGVELWKEHFPTTERREGRV